MALAFRLIRYPGSWQKWMRNLYTYNVHNDDDADDIDDGMTFAVSNPLPSLQVLSFCERAFGKL